MISLTQYINEDIDQSIFKKVVAMRNKSKKLDLLAIKKGLGTIDENDLKTKAETIYSGLVNYKNDTEMIAALDGNKVDGWKDINDAITKANSNNPVPTDTIIDIIEKIASGAKLDVAIADAAKNIK